MAFDFPASPSEGQEFTPPVAGAPTYVYEAPRWKSKGQIQGISTSDGPPANPVSGQLWWESDTGNMFVYYTDANSSQWVQLNGSPIPDAPADGNEYVRVNGVWRLSKQRFDFTGSLDVPVPSWGPHHARLSFVVYSPSASSQMCALISTDGTTFPNASGDYYIAGNYHLTATGTVGNTAWVPFPYINLVSTMNAAPIPTTGDLFMQLDRPGGAGSYINHYWKSWAYEPTNGFVLYDYVGAGVTFSGSATVKAVRFFSPTGASFIGELVAEWLP